jgi:hypothetical protein
MYARSTNDHSAFASARVCMRKATSAGGRRTTARWRVKKSKAYMSRYCFASTFGQGDWVFPDVCAAMKLKQIHDGGAR